MKSTSARILTVNGGSRQRRPRHRIHNCSVRSVSDDFGRSQTAATNAKRPLETEAAFLCAEGATEISLGLEQSD